MHAHTQATRMMRMGMGMKRCGRTASTKLCMYSSSGTQRSLTVRSVYLLTSRRIIA